MKEQVSTPTATIYGRKRKLSDWEIAILDIYSKLDIVAQAKLVAYAADLESENHIKEN